MDEPLSARIFMQVVKFHPPEGFVFDLNRMPCRLPKSPISIIGRCFSDCLTEQTGHFVVAIVRQLPACELAKFRNRLLQIPGDERLVENDRVHMGWHDDVGVDPQSLVEMAEVQAVGHDLESFLANENGKPFNHAECHEEYRTIGMKTVTFHRKLG